MILRSVMLENFRQFYGIQTIDFATSDDRNVTVISEWEKIACDGIASRVADTRLLVDLDTHSPSSEGIPSEDIGGAIELIQGGSEGG